MKRILSVFLAFFLAFTISCVSYAGKTSQDAQAVAREYTEIMHESELAEAKWNGRAALRAGRCYHVSGNVTVKKSFTVPKGSVLVLDEGAKLTVKNKSTLTVNGAVAISDKAKLNIYIGTMNISEDAAVIADGTLAVSKKGTVRISGYMAAREFGAQLRIKGRMYTENGGYIDMFCEEMKVYKGADVDCRTIYYNIWNSGKNDLSFMGKTYQAVSYNLPFAMDENGVLLDPAPDYVPDRLTYATVRHLLALDSFRFISCGTTMAERSDGWLVSGFFFDDNGEGSFYLSEDGQHILYICPADMIAANTEEYYLAQSYGKENIYHAVLLSA